MGGGGLSPLIFQMNILFSMFYTTKRSPKLLSEGFRNTPWEMKIPNFPGGACSPDPLVDYWLSLCRKPETPPPPHFYRVFSALVQVWIVTKTNPSKLNITSISFNLYSCNTLWKLLFNQHSQIQQGRKCTHFPFTLLYLHWFNTFLSNKTIINTSVVSIVLDEYIVHVDNRKNVHGPDR